MNIDLDAEFPLDPTLSYLNHAAVSPWPQRTVRAVTTFAQANGRYGSHGYMEWLNTEARLRQRLGRLINAAPADIALLKSTSEGLSVVAHGLEWQAGDNVVIPDEEFPSNRIVWESLRRYGVEVRYANLDGDSSPERALMALTDHRTRLLSVSAVQYASGLRMGLAELGSACAESGILFCVDAIQWLGALPFDSQQVQAAFVVADGHKWMLGPEGLALFYCRPDVRDRLRLSQYGWHMTEFPGEFDRKEWRPAVDARRFECGSPNLLGAHGLEASLSLLEEVGVETVAQRIAQITDYLIQRIERHPQLALLSPAAPERRAGIVTFTHTAHRPEQLYCHLMEHRVMCAQRGGGIRFSPHFYTSTRHIDRALEVLEAYG